MTPAEQDAKTAHKLAQLRAEALTVQTGFGPGTAEHCLADAVVRAVGMVDFPSPHGLCQAPPEWGEEYEDLALSSKTKAAVG